MRTAPELLVELFRLGASFHPETYQLIFPHAMSLLHRDLLTEAMRNQSNIERIIADEYYATRTCWRWRQ